MKWIRFFTNVDGRITRKTFWLASIAVLMIELLIAAAAAATAEEFADEGDRRFGDGHRFICVSLPSVRDLREARS